VVSTSSLASIINIQHVAIKRQWAEADNYLWHSTRPEPISKSDYIRRPMIGVEGCGSISHGKKIQVSWETSVTKVSTNGRPAGFA